MAAVKSMEHFSSLSSYLMAYAMKLTNNVQESQDLYQDTALLAHRHREKFKSGSNLKAWTRTIMKNVFINKFRKKKTGISIADHKGEGYVFESNLNNSDVNSGESKITLDELSEIVEELSPDLKSAFSLAYSGYKYKDISKMLAVPVGTIKSRIFLAKKELRARIRKHYRIDSYKELL